MFRLPVVVLLALVGASCLRAQPQSLTVIRRVDASTGIVLVDKTLMRTTDNGKSWVNITPRLSASETAVTAYFLDEITGWSVLSVSSKTGEFTSVKVVSTGSSGGFSDGESSVVPVSHEFLQSWGAAAYLTFVDAKHGWLELQSMSSSNFKYGLMFRTEDGGRSWTELPAPPTVDQTRFISSNVGWIAGGPGGDRLYRTVNGGRSWTDDRVSPPTVPQATQAFYTLPQVDNAGRVFVGVTSIQSTAQADFATLAIYISNDEGSTWEPYAVQDQIPGSGRIPMDIAGKAIVSVGSDGDSTESRLTGNGNDAKRISRIRAPAQGAFLSIYFVNQFDGWLVVEHDFCVNKTHCELQTRLLHTLDGGVSTHDITPTLTTGVGEVGDHLLPQLAGLMIRYQARGVRCAYQAHPRRNAAPPA